MSSEVGGRDGICVIARVALRREPHGPGDMSSVRHGGRCLTQALLHPRKISAYADQTVLVGTFTARPAFGRLVEMARAHVVVVHQLTAAPEHSSVVKRNETKRREIPT